MNYDQNEAMLAIKEAEVELKKQAKQISLAELLDLAEAPKKEIQGWKLSHHGNYYKKFDNVLVTVGYSMKEGGYWTLLLMPAGVKKNLDEQQTSERAMEIVEKIFSK